MYSLFIIDHSYCGEKDQIHAILKAPSLETSQKKNLGPSNLHIKIGERVAQLILEKNNDIEWDEQDVSNFVVNSRGGFGSTGR